MLISQNLRTAFRGLTANKLRSALTLLGIVIGVAAVVALMAIGNGATSSITSRIESNGTNLITIMTARFRSNAGTPAQFSYLTLDDYQALKTRLANVAAIAPSYQSTYDVKQGSPEEIKFIADSDPDAMGTYLYDDGETHAHVITISDARCGHLDTIIKHRHKGGRYAGYQYVQASFCNIFTGHTHVRLASPISAFDQKTYWGVQTGTLADINSESFQYTEDNAKDWRQGFIMASWERGQLLMPEMVMTYGEDEVMFRGEILAV